MYIHFTANYIVCNTKRVSHKNSARTGNVTYYVNYGPFPTAPRTLGSRHDIIFVFFTLDS